MNEMQTAVLASKELTVQHMQRHTCIWLKMTSKNSGTTPLSKAALIMLILGHRSYDIVQAFSGAMDISPNIPMYMSTSLNPPKRSRLVLALNLSIHYPSSLLTSIQCLSASYSRLIIPVVVFVGQPPYRARNGPSYRRKGDSRTPCW